MARKRLLVVGNGMAGLRLLEELLALAPDRYAITVIGAEPEPAYNRVLLSSLLAGEIDANDIALKPRTWYAEHGIELLTGRPAVALERTGRRLLLDGGESLSFDSLVLATGADPIKLDLPGSDLRGVLTFRALGDVEHLLAAAEAGAPAVVIGGGLLGIEAAFGLVRAGVPVTLVHLMDRLMERQLDAASGRLLKQALEAKGIEVLLEAQTRAILGGSAVEAVELADGRRIVCGLAVVAAGVRPSVALAVSGGLGTKRGIVVDDRLQTSASGIYAIGDCAEHRGTCYGLVEPAYEHARIAARSLAGKGDTYAGSVQATNLKVSGVPVFSAGDFEGKGAEHIVMCDEGASSYRKYVVRDGRLAGVVLIGDTHDALWYAGLIRGGAVITPFRDTLAFGRAFAEAA